MDLLDNYMVVSYKIQIYPNKTQSKIIKDTINACKFVYNKYLYDRQEYYKETGKTLKWKEYRKVIKKLRKQEEYYWLRENIFSHALYESIHNVDRAYESFFEGISNYPKYKRKKNPVLSYYVDANCIYYNGNKFHLPMLGDIRISEYNYIPRDSSTYIGGCITYNSKIDKYYLVVRASSNKLSYKYYYDYSMAYGNYGIDVGINTYAYIANKDGDSFTIGDNIIKSDYITKLNNRIDKLNSVKFNKMNTNKEKGIGDKNGWSNNCSKIQKKINKTYKKKSNYVTNYINDLIIGLVKTKPESITIESLDIIGLLSNRNSKSYKRYEKTLHKHIQDSKFRYFYDQLIFKSHICDGMEVRQIGKYEASTQTCSVCGNKHKVPLYTRIYVCDNPKCIMYNIPTERDYNSAYYLANNKDYVVL